MPLVPRINLKKSLRRMGLSRQQQRASALWGTCAEALLEPRWGWVGTWARMVNAEGLRRFLVTDASRGGWSDKADKIKTGPVRWNETSSDPQEGVSSGHFAGKQTGPSAENQR